MLPGRQEGSEAGAVGTGGIAEVAPAPAPAPAPSQPPVDPDAEPLEVEIRPSAVIWVTATADGERVLFRLLKPGEQVSVKARGDLSFRVGDAGAFQYSVNGAAGKPVGTSGEVTEFRITRENYRTFRR